MPLNWQRIIPRKKKTSLPNLNRLKDVFANQVKFQIIISSSISLGTSTDIYVYTYI